MEKVTWSCGGGTLKYFRKSVRDRRSSNIKAQSRSTRKAVGRFRNPSQVPEGVRPRLGRAWRLQALLPRELEAMAGF
jgi:hypothetical protein